MMMDQGRSILPNSPAVSDARRRFLAACGKTAIAVPPAISLMLAGERNYASAASAGSAGYGSATPMGAIYARARASGAPSLAA